jgi:hypothetical protein
MKFVDWLTIMNKEIKMENNIELNEELSDIREQQYFSLDKTISCLDGYFTSEQLRRIADAMDKLNNGDQK